MSAKSVATVTRVIHLISTGSRRRLSATAFRSGPETIGGTIRDPFGHEWNIGHEIEKLTPEEMQRRYTELMAQSA